MSGNSLIFALCFFYERSMIVTNTNRADVERMNVTKAISMWPLKDKYIHMKFILIFFILGISVFEISANDINFVRKSFHQAVLEESKIDDFHEYINTLPATEPIIVAYKAMGQALMAQQAWNPIDKYICIKNFEELINSAVENEPTNLEIRFLRICIEYYLPEWLPISNHLEIDKCFVLTNLNQMRSLDFDPEFIRYISYFLKEPGLFSPEQSTLIDQEFLTYMNQELTDKSKIKG
ncbi:MAG: hypothetical protein ACJA08_000231 [Cyclobacteriaceae bacterium]|jgi:hypothetical protein